MAVFEVTVWEFKKGLKATSYKTTLGVKSVTSKALDKALLFRSRQRERMGWSEN